MPPVPNLLAFYSPRFFFFFFCLFIYLLLYPWAILKVTGYVFSQETLRWRLIFVRDPNLWKEGERRRIGQEKKLNCNTGLINFGQSPVSIWSGPLVSAECGPRCGWATITAHPQPPAMLLELVLWFISQPCWRGPDRQFFRRREVGW